MANPIITAATSGLSAEVRIHYNKTLLMTGKPELLHMQFCEKYPIPAGEGRQVQLRRSELIPVSATPLEDGVTPNPDTMIYSSVQIPVNQYGRWVALDDLVDLTSIDPILANVVERQGQQAGQTFDQLARDMMNAGATTQFTGGHTARNQVTTTDQITTAAIKKAVKTLKKNYAMKRGGDWIAICSPDTTSDLQSLADWLNPSYYKDTNTNLYTGEIGKLYGVRFVESTLAKVFTGQGASGVDVQSTLFFGAQAFGCTEYSGRSLKTYFHGLGSGGATDPLEQRQTQGWKGSWGGAITNDLFVVRLEHYATP